MPEITEIQKQYKEGDPELYKDQNEATAKLMDYYEAIYNSYANSLVKEILKVINENDSFK